MHQQGRRTSKAVLDANEKTKKQHDDDDDGVDGNSRSLVKWMPDNTAFTMVASLSQFKQEQIYKLFGIMNMASFRDPSDSF